MARKAPSFLSADGQASMSSEHAHIPTRLDRSSVMFLKEAKENGSKSCGVTQLGAAPQSTASAPRHSCRGSGEAL